MAEIDIRIAGEGSMIVYFNQPPSATLAKVIGGCCERIKTEFADSLVDILPSYASILVIYDVTTMDYYQALGVLRQCIVSLTTLAEVSGNTVELPVYYGTEVGWDLQDLATSRDLTPEDIALIHQAGNYQVYAIGFAPGFAYLGQVDEKIAAPRLATPRLKVPKGAVAIADRQTAVYPAQSPGGWNIIGRCPVAMFDPDGSPPMPVSAGDSVKFYAIDKDEYLRLGGEL